MVVSLRLGCEFEDSDERWPVCIILKEIFLVLDRELSSELQVVWGEVEPVKFLFVNKDCQLKNSFRVIWIAPRNYLTVSRLDSPSLPFIAPLPYGYLDSVTLIYYHLRRPYLLVCRLLSESQIHYMWVLLKVSFDGYMSRLLLYRVPAQMHTWSMHTCTCSCLGQGDVWGRGVGWVVEGLIWRWWGGQLECEVSGVQVGRWPMEGSTVTWWQVLRRWQVQGVIGVVDEDVGRA